MVGALCVFASDTGTQLPESGVFAELLNIGAVCGEHFHYSFNGYLHGS